MTDGIKDADKRFATLRAAAALAGFEIWRTNPADGPVRYLAGRWGVVRDIGSPDDAERFLQVVGVGL